MVSDSQLDLSVSEEQARLYVCVLDVAERRGSSLIHGYRVLFKKCRQGCCIIGLNAMLKFRVQASSFTSTTTF